MITGLKIECAKREILTEDQLEPFMFAHHFNRLKDAEPYLNQNQGFQMQVSIENQLKSEYHPA